MALLQWLRSEQVVSRARWALPYIYLVFVASIVVTPKIAVSRDLYYILVLPCFVLALDLRLLRAVGRNLVWHSVGALLIYLLITLSWSENASAMDFIQDTRHFILILVFVALTAYLVAATPQFPARLLRFVLIIAALGAAYTMVVTFRTGFVVLENRIATAGFLNSNITAAVYGTLIAGGFFYCLLGAKSQVEALVFAIAVLILIAFVGLTESRGAALGLLAAILAGGLLVRARWAIAGTAIIAVALAALVLTHNAEFARFNLRGDSYRLEIWSHFLGVWKQHPWFGIGLKTDPKFTTQDGYEILHQHNVYLAYLVHGGIVGLGLFVAMLAAAATEAWRQFTQQRERGLLAMLIFVAICLATEFTIFQENLGWQWIILWLPIGLAAGAGVQRANAALAPDRAIGLAPADAAAGS